jgi:lipopolysaccharide export system protein LptC
VKSAIYFPLVLAVLLAIITFWINLTVEQQGPKIDGSNRHDPDYTMHDFVTSQTDINGNLSYVLAAGEMVHYPDDDSTVLQRPRFTQYTVDKPYTQIEGLRAYVSSDGEKIEMVDNVKVVRQAFEGKGEMQLMSEKLTILPKQDLVKTNSPVLIKQMPKTVIRANGGMIYDKKARTIQLFNRVRAHYERPPAVAVKKKKAKPEKAAMLMNKDLKDNVKPVAVKSAALGLIATNKSKKIEKKQNSNKATNVRKKLILSKNTRSNNE